MCYRSLCLIMIIVLWSTPGLLALNPCEKLLHQLAQKQSLFVQCSTLHSVPVKLCGGCEEQYTDMQVAYISLREETNCTEKFFDKDRINIVSTTQSILVSLWTRAYCDDCFTGNNSSIFDSKLEAFSGCLLENKEQECALCLAQYLDLNGFYLNLDTHNNGQVCYDMQDSMNRTRARWSKELGCCHRKFDMLLFLVTSGFVALLPALFYSATYYLTKRHERNHDLLIEDAEDNTPTVSGNANNAASDPPIAPSTSARSSTPFAKKNVEHMEPISSDDSDSDTPANALKSKSFNKP